MTALNEYARIYVRGEPMIERETPITSDEPYMELHAASKDGGLVSLSIMFGGKGFLLMQGTWAQAGFLAAALHVAHAVGRTRLDMLMGVYMLDDVREAYAKFRQDWEYMKHEVGA